MNHSLQLVDFSKKEGEMLGKGRGAVEMDAEAEILRRLRECVR